GRRPYLFPPLVSTSRSPCRHRGRKSGPLVVLLFFRSLFFRSLFFRSLFAVPVFGRRNRTDRRTRRTRRRRRRKAVRRSGRERRRGRCLPPIRAPKRRGSTGSYVLDWAPGSLPRRHGFRRRAARTGNTTVA
ncbi:unnamed protein product, partial [Ectocarpus sp. 4 AP-2014]